MSYGDIRIWQGEVTSYWGWELSVDGNPGEGGRKIGGWASSRERAFSDAMTQLRLDAAMGLHLDEDRTPPPLESAHGDRSL